jgi:hypothetical protein
MKGFRILACRIFTIRRKRTKNVTIAVARTKKTKPAFLNKTLTLSMKINTITAVFFAFHTILRK